MIDLHIHTMASDGTDPPEEIIRIAAEKDVTAMAITDHDTVGGVNRAIIAGKQYGIEVVPGIEVSVNYSGIEVHVLGYFIDQDSPELKPVLDWVVDDRNSRNEKIVMALQRDGYDISIAELCEKNPGVVIGRPHIAELLMQHGYVESIKQAFDQLLAEGRPYFLYRSYLPFKRAIEVIRNAGGVAVAAHPLQYKFDEEKLYSYLRKLRDLGGVGMETMYSLYSPDETKYLENIAEKLGLKKTGGSDYHGRRKPHINIGVGCGDMRVPDEYLEILKGGR